MDGGEAPVQRPLTRNMTSNLYDKLSKPSTLRKAWYHVREAGIRSVSEATRDAIAEFADSAEKNLARIQLELRKDEYAFSPQEGVAISKSGKKKKPTEDKKRPIVVSPIGNRVVERAILDCLQKHVPYVQEILNTRTSIGGIPDRGVGHGIALVSEALQQPGAYYIRSDITNFFPSIERAKVFDLIEPHINDPKFMDIFKRATRVILANEDKLGEEIKWFPTSETGIAQGSPLSPLLGNILLYEFDKKFNSHGITCVRFIDDFVLIGKEPNVKKAFSSAKKFLSNLNLQCHDPTDPNTPKEKAQHGLRNKEFVFLGYSMSHEVIRPSEKAVSSLLEKIEVKIAQGKKSITKCQAEHNSFASQNRYVQTLTLIDRTVRGWGDAFAYSNTSLSAIDDEIDEILRSLKRWYRNNSIERSIQDRRRMLGVCLLSDIKPKSLENLPFRFSKNKKHKISKETIIISTDGSSVSKRTSAGVTIRFGGWAAVFHATNKSLQDSAYNATNQEMELVAVINAIKHCPQNARVLIFTDSKYVCETVNSGQVVRDHVALWKELQNLCDTREIIVKWVKGHSGDQYNELADKLANTKANQAKEMATGNR